MAVLAPGQSMRSEHNHQTTFFFSVIHAYKYYENDAKSYLVFVSL